MSEKQISTGEAAKISGLTVRTLQHYDNLGVLPASGRTEGGRRYYTESDMMKLEQVVFYRGLGFSLVRIKEKLLDGALDDDDSKLLERQKTCLHNQISAIQNSITAIEASQELIAAGRTPPWMLLATFMQSLGTVDISAWSDFEFSEEQTEIFMEHLPTLEAVIKFYNDWKRLTIKAAAFNEVGVQIDEPIAKKLAEDWLALVQTATGGNEQHTDAYLEVDRHRETWSPAERALIEKAEPFLNGLTEYYGK